MPNYKVVNADQLDTDLTSVSNAIRAKAGTTDAMAFPNGMVAAVNGISTPKEEQAKSITVTANGTQTVSPDSGKVLSGVTVNVNVPSTSPVLQTKSVSPATSVQRVSPDAGYDGLSAVTVEAVTAAIDSNIQPANIAAGVSILGVTGTHSGGARLNAPTIGLSGDTLTITDGNNGSFTQKYAIYADGTKRAETTAASYDLSALGLSAGTYAITVKAVGSGMTDSAASNSVSYTVIQIYTITPTLTNVTAAASNPSSIAAGSTATLTFTANSGYTLPDTVAVTGATGVWDKATGKLTISNLTGNVSFSITGVAIPSGYTVTVEDSYFAGSGFCIYDGNGTSGTKLTDQVVSWTGTITSGYVTIEAMAYEISAPSTTGGVKLQSKTYGDYDYPIYVYSVTGNGTITGEWACFAEGTRILLADGTTKPVEAVTYRDKLATWDFAKGKASSAYPMWIKVKQTASYHYLVTLDDGTEIRLVGSGGNCHRLFNADKQAFIYANECVGDHVSTVNGIRKVVSCERIEEAVNYYNIITENHFNLYANGILTSCRLSNLYPIDGMKYVDGAEPAMTDAEISAYIDRLKDLRL